VSEQGKDIYSGFYARFDTVSKKEASQLLGSDNLVGDIYEIEFRLEDKRRIAWLKNRFGAVVGFFGEDTSRELSLAEARGWKISALLSFVAYTDSPAPGEYWGEAAIVCFDPQEEAVFSVFLEGLSKVMAEGLRLNVELGKQGVAQVLANKGKWTPKNTVPLPGKEKGVAFLKTRRGLNEGLVELARQRNVGCYIASWLFVALVLVGIFFGLKSCGLF